MDKASITRLPSGDVRVRAKLVQTTEKGVIEMERALELEGKNIRYGHMIGLYEVKCTKRMYNAQSLKAYSKEGTVIRELFEQPSVDVPIESDSFMGKLHKLLCN